MVSLRIVFMGTPMLACISLRQLIATPGLHVVGVVTQPDAPKGRNLKTQPSPVKHLATSHNLAVLQPEHARAPDFLNQLRLFEPELIVVAAYGQILPVSVLELPRLGCLNVHTSLLPKYRGAAPIQWALLNGENVTGVTIMLMNAGLDTGPILTQECSPILDADTAESIHDRLAEIGASLLVRTIPEYAAGRIQPKPQPEEGVSYAPKIKKTDGRLHWNESARVLWNRVRGLTPWPGAFTFLEGTPKPVLLKIWKAEPVSVAGVPGAVLDVGKSGITVACEHDSLRILELQREGGRRMKAAEFLAGLPIKPGQSFE
jgi:methionyl-tRNA formyltransferase